MIRPLLFLGAALIMTAAARTNTAPRANTPWGDPDLQAVWTSGPMIDVPFERRRSLGTRGTLTDAEFAERTAENRRQMERDLSPTAPRDGAVASPEHWLERGLPSRQASLIVDPPNGRLPRQTEDGAERARQWRVNADRPRQPEDLNPYDRCITRGVLGSILPNIYNSATQILQTRDTVTLYHEMIHETRIVYLDGRPHLPSGIRLYMGDSRGHWENGTLVVETTNFNGKTGSYGRNGNGNPTSEQLRLTERFMRTDANTLQYSATVDDPETWTKPWTLAFPLTREEHYGMYEYACHEGNYALRNILSGARANDRQ
jgi:hypothetical protein